MRSVSPCPGQPCQATLSNSYLTVRVSAIRRKAKIYGQHVRLYAQPMLDDAREAWAVVVLYLPYGECRGRNLVLKSYRNE